MSYLLDLLPELQEIIFSYCTAKDLTNLASCNSLCKDNYTLKETLWRRIVIPGTSLVKQNLPHLEQGALENLKFTHDIVLGSVATVCSKILGYCIPEKLHTLTIHGNNNIGFSCQSFVNLKEFTLFTLIGKLDGLVELSFICKYINDSHVEVICNNLVMLKVLNISHSLVSDKGMSFLVSLKSLEDLDVAGCWKISDAGVSHIGSVTTLRKLNLSGCDNVTFKSLQALSNLKYLSKLDISNHYMTISDIELSYVGALISLDELVLYDCRNIIESGVLELSRQTNLKHLNIGYTHVNGMSHISNMLNLRTLILCYSQLRDADVLHLCLLTKLEILDISHCRNISDIALSHISSMTSLGYLDIRNTPEITNVGLKYLERLRSLRALKCNKDIVTDDIISLLSDVQITH